MRSLKYLTMVVAMALVAAGCGGGGGGGGGGSSSGPIKGLVQQPGKVENGRVIVNIENNAFKPSTLAIPANTQVVWTNSDNVSHSIVKTNGPGPDFNSGPLQPGSTFSQVLRDTGTYQIADQQTKSPAAPKMSIVVKPPSAAQPAPGGQP